MVEKAQGTDPWFGDAIRRNRVIYSVCFALVVSLFLVGTTWRDEVRYLFNTEGFRPAGHRVGLVALLVALLAVVIWMLTGALDQVRREYERHIASLYQQHTPPVNDSGTGHDARSLIVAAYEAKGFVFGGDLYDLPGSPGMWADPGERLDENNLLRRAGLVVYEDGSATHFTVAVLTRDDVWSPGDEVNVRRRQTGRPVSIRTALNRPLVRELVQSNDYVIAVGMASSKPTRSDERNANLAHARAFNIGYAIVQLGFKEAARVHAFSLGYATEPPTLEGQEPLQRAVVVVGANASRDIVVADIVAACSRLLRVDGVNLDSYSSPPRRLVRMRSFVGATQYLRADAVQITRQETGDWILPAIEEGDRR